MLAQLADEFDYVFHLATYHGNQSSIANPLADHENNLITTLKLFERLEGLRAAAQARLRGVRLHARASTPTATRRPRRRTGRCRSTSTARTRSRRSWASSTPSTTTGGTGCRPCARASRTSTAPARSSAPAAGAGRQRRSGATSTPTFVYRALKGLPLELDNGGIASRDFVYVGDVVDGLIRCAEAGAPGDVYNLASGVETSIRELAETIVEHVRLRLGAPDRSRHATGTAPGIDSAAPPSREKEIGFVASMGLEQGLRETIDWTTRHMDLIDAAVARHADRVGLAVGEPTVA